MTRPQQSPGWLCPDCGIEVWGERCPLCGNDRNLEKPNTKMKYLSEAKWIDLSEQEPGEEQEVLTETKNGYVSGYYDKAENTFSGYHFGREATWYASQWLPLKPQKKPLPKCSRCGGDAVPGDPGAYFDEADDNVQYCSKCVEEVAKE